MITCICNREAGIQLPGAWASLEGKREILPEESVSTIQRKAGENIKWHQHLEGTIRVTVWPNSGESTCFKRLVKNRSKRIRKWRIYKSKNDIKPLLLYLCFTFMSLRSTTGVSGLKKLRYKDFGRVNSQGHFLYHSWHNLSSSNRNTHDAGHICDKKNQKDTTCLEIWETVNRQYVLGPKNIFR